MINFKCFGCEHGCSVDTGSLFGKPSNCIATGEAVDWQYYKEPLNKVVEDGQAKCTCSPNGVQVKCDVHGFTGGFIAPPAT